MMMNRFLNSQGPIANVLLPIVAVCIGLPLLMGLVA